MKPVDFIYLGPPKTASTWLYECLKEHPGVQVSKDGETYFFDIYYGRGEEWYERTQFTEDAAGRLRVDCGPTYAYNPIALERIHAHNPKMKLAVGLRNPIDRAFSHYWHIKKKSLVSLNFDQSLTDYTAFWTWMKTSMVSYGVRKCIDMFGRDNLFVMPFETAQKEPEKTLSALLDFIGADKGFKPPSTNKRFNVAGPRHTLLQRASYKAAKAVMGEDELTRRAKDSKFFALVSGKDEYVRGVDPEFRRTLTEIFEPEIAELERLLDIDLSAWRTV